MKKYLLALLLIPTVVMAESSVFDQGEWFLEKYRLSTYTHKPITINGQVYDHSLFFSTPSGGTGQSDLCFVASANNLNCISGDSVTYNATVFSATLTSPGFGTYTYYDKDHIPTGSPLVGTWHRVNPRADCRNGQVASIVVPYQNKDATRFTNVDIYFLDDSGYSHFNTYYIVKDKYTGRLGFDQPTSYNAYYLYDKDNNPITELDKIDTLAKLNDGYYSKYDPQCDLVK